MHSNKYGIKFTYKRGSTDDFQQVKLSHTWTPIVFNCKCSIEVIMLSIQFKDYMNLSSLVM
jgi:hypothetical protein